MITLLERPAENLDLQELLDELTRRRFLIGTAVLTSLAACRPEELVDAVGSASSGPWSFVDDRGIDITLPSVPTRVVAEADAAAALWDFGIRPVGIFASSPLADAAQLVNVDLSTVESVGETYGEINLEKLAVLEPDIVVAVYYPPPEDEILYGVKNRAQAKQLEEIAPTIGIDAHVVADDAIARMADLASSLGVDLNGAEVSGARDRYERAAQALTATSAAKPLRVLAVYPGTDELYVLRPKDSADLAFLQRLGVNLIDPEGDQPYYEVLSWEQAGKYDADVIVMDQRVLDLETSPFAQQPTWKRLPAVSAQQIGSWISPAPFSYQAYTLVLEEMKGLLEGSLPVT